MTDRSIPDIVKFLIILIICLAAGLFGSLLTAPALAAWYSALEKPFFTPPDWLFAPVWTLLYVLMSISATLVWRSGHTETRNALGTFSVQLILNALWSLAFFGLRSPFVGLIEIIFLWIAILVTIKAFFRISRTSGYLLIPYILWVTLALLLNFFIWRLN
jgi:benzodiazapine receptor